MDLTQVDKTSTCSCLKLTQISRIISNLSNTCYWSDSSTCYRRSRLQKSPAAKLDGM